MNPPSRVVRRSAVVSPRVFEKKRTVGRRAAQSRLVRGDNLDALAWLRAEFEGVFRCVYLDPPFNTGRTFAEYGDARSPEEWRGFMRDRLLAIVPLMAEDGALFLEIDDTELGSALSLCDEVFGRAARVSTVTVVRSASTGHKAKNRGPVNVTDYLLVYERVPGAWTYRPERRARLTYDRAYSTYVANPKASPSAWQFDTLARAFAQHEGFGSVAGAKKAFGSEGFERAKEGFAVAHAEHVIRFAQPRFEAVSRAAQRAIVRSREEPARVFRLERPGFPDLLLRGGNRILFLSSKVVTTADGPRLVEPLTNVWDDIPFQGIAKEGGVTFRRNKKPERLLERIVRLATDPGDWVLDPFLGSGTTAAVAEKLGRQWVGVEAGEVLWSLAVPRLERVLRGEDTTGIAGLGARERSRFARPSGGFGIYA